MSYYKPFHYTVPIVINEEGHTITVRAADTLLYVLREQLGLTGAKSGCDNGDCGACTVLLNHLPMKACLMLAVEAAGQRVTTIEGLKNSRMQHAFLEKWAFQCGFCTSGFIMNCHALASFYPDASEETIQRWLESNICRCLSYEEIREAVKSALSDKNKS